MSLKDKLQEVYNSLQDRFRSPFIITFILVWCVHNWELVFYVFSFDDKMPFVRKYALFKAYITVYGACHLLWLPGFFTFLSIGLYMFVSFITEALTLYYNKWLRPFLYVKIDNNKIVSKEDYNRLREKNNRMSTQLNTAQEKASDALASLKQAEENLQHSEQQIFSLMSEKEGISATFESVEKTSLERANEITQLKKQLEEQEKTFNAQSEKQKEKFNAQKASLILNSTETEADKFKLWIESSNPDLIQAWAKAKITMAPEIQQLIDDRKKLEVFFSNGSNWSVQFIQNDTIIREDYLSVEKVDNDLYFRVNNYELFLISNIQFPDNESIRFVKTRIDQHIPVLNNEDSTEVTLSYKSDNSFYGHEKNILVIYRPASGYGLNNLAIPITYKS